MPWLKIISKLDYWLLSLAVALVAIHLTYLEQANEPNLTSLSFLLWLGIASLIWDRRDRLKLESDIFSSFIGISLIALVLLRSLSPAGYHVMISPFLSGIALCLIASGIERLHHYWKELLLLSLILFYPVLTGFLKAINLTLITAKFSVFLLWCAGFTVYRDNVTIFMPTGRVEVYGDCSGIDSIILMLYITILFVLMVPLKWFQQIVCAIVAMCLGFLVNSFRVAVLASLVTQKTTFDFWHGGNGSFIFSTITVFLFGIFCWWAYVRKLTVIE